MMATVIERKKPSQTPLRLKRILTTGDVARHAGVAPRTVAMWVDSGRLSGYRIPGSQDRRIPLANYIHFLKQHNMPLNGLHESWTILLIGAGDMLADRLGAALAEEDGFVFLRAESAFEAGIQAAGCLPDVVLIDLGMGRSEALAIARRLAADPAHGGAAILVIASEDEPDQKALQAEFAGMFRRPFDPELLAQALRNLAGV